MLQRCRLWAIARPRGCATATQVLAAILPIYLDFLKAALLGMVEGLTEFLPVSSTGHLLLVGHFFGFDDDDFGKSFTILIQLGAILALLTIYFTRLWNLANEFFRSWATARFVIGVLLAFLPAAVMGALFHSFIKAVLFDVRIVCFMLILGGFVLLWVDRMSERAIPFDATEFPLWMYFGIGLFQVAGDDPRRVARRRHHRRRDAVRR